MIDGGFGLGGAVAGFSSNAVGSMSRILAGSAAAAEELSSRLVRSRPSNPSLAFGAGGAGGCVARGAGAADFPVEAPGRGGGPVLAAGAGAVSSSPLSSRGRSATAAGGGAFGG